MTGKSIHRVAFRRRREGKTDYRMRKRMILSSHPRLVIRGSLKHMNIQVITARPEGDIVLTSAHSEEVSKMFGWKAPCGNIPTAYLTGLLAGYRAQAEGLPEAILDIGIRSPSRGSRVFAALKGAVDSGFKVKHDETVLPAELRVRGEHIASYARELLSTDPGRYEAVFSGYLSRGLRPERIGGHFDQVKAMIIERLEGK
ncbi:MAG: 50S ribosomal protein L18 [Candidatus Bathyarchaeia archaeon]